MLKLTIITLLTVGLMAFGQSNKDKSEKGEKSSSHQKGPSESKGKKMKDNGQNNNSKQKGDKDQSHKKDQKDYVKKDNQKDMKHANKKYDNDEKHYAKDHPNFNYVYKNKHGYYSYKNYGQWRSEQARNKHKNYRPLYEYQAVEGYRLINNRNIFLYDEADYKIDLINARLIEKQKANQIDDVQYNWYSSLIELIQQRRKALDFY